MRPMPSGCCMCLWEFMSDFEDGEDGEDGEEDEREVTSKRKELRSLFGVEPVEKVVAVNEDGTERVVRTDDDSYLFPNMVY